MVKVKYFGLIVKSIKFIGQYSHLVELLSLGIWSTLVLNLVMCPIRENSLCGGAVGAYILSIRSLRPKRDFKSEEDL